MSEDGGSSSEFLSVGATPLLRSPSMMTRDGRLTEHARKSKRTRARPSTVSQARAWACSRVKCLVVAAVLLGAVTTMGIVYNPGPYEYATQTAGTATASGWATKAAACSGGGTVEDMVVNASMVASAEAGDTSAALLTYKCRAPRLSWESYATAGITFMALLFMVNNNPPDVVMLTATVCLLVLRIITQADAWGGFSTPGVMSVAVLFVVAQGLQEVGVVDRLLRAVLGSPTSLFVAQIRLLFPVAVISAFMNNTPVVAMMIPIIDSWSQRIGIAKSKFLIPLSFASMLGGMCTLIGTSTNLILAALIARDDPSQAIGMFDMSPVGAPLLIIGVLYMAVASRFLLPDKGGQDVSATTTKIYQAFFVIPARSALAGRTLKATGLMALRRLTLAYVERGHVTLAAKPELELQPGDRILVEGVPEALAKLRRQRGVRLDSATVLQLGTRRRRRVLVEVVLGRSSPLLGLAPSNCADVLQQYEAAIVAVRAAGGHPVVTSPKSASFASDRSRPPSGVATSLPRAVAAPRRRHPASSPFSLNGSASTPTPTPPGATARTAPGATNAASSSVRRPMSVSIDDGSDDTRRSTVSPRTNRRDDPLRPARLPNRGASADIESGADKTDTATRSSEGNDRLTPLLTSPYVSTRGTTATSGLADEAVFQPGDALVLEVYRSFLRMHLHSVDFALVRLVENSKPPRMDTGMDKLRAVIASLSLVGMVVAAALNVLSLLTAALCASLIMIAFKVLTVEDAFRAIRARVIIAIVCTFGIGLALQNTGVAGFLASGLVDAALNVGEGFLLFSIFAVACIAGSVVSNNANVILMYPICVKASQLVPSIPLKQFCIVLMMASSMSFMTPIGYQTNLMVMAPGGYRFTDYAKLGVLMQVVLGICAVILTRHFIS